MSASSIVLRNRVEIKSVTRKNWKKKKKKKTKKKKNYDTFLAVLALL